MLYFESLTRYSTNYWLPPAAITGGEVKPNIAPEHAGLGGRGSVTSPQPASAVHNPANRDISTILTWTI